MAYLSAKFLTGPHLGNGLINSGIWQNVEDALKEVGQDLLLVLEQEEEPGLGNGGLGRLAACYMDSTLHTNLLKQTVLKDFYRVAPEKFHNVANGVTPWRWIALSNPKLSALITRHIGDRWLANLEDELRHLEGLAVDVAFPGECQAVKADNKRASPASSK